MLVVCAGVPVGEGVAVGVGATVLVVCGWPPKGDALGKGVTVAVGTGLDCNGVTVAVGCGPAGTGICATAPRLVRQNKIKTTEIFMLQIQSNSRAQLCPPFSQAPNARKAAPRNEPGVSLSASRIRGLRSCPGASGVPDNFTVVQR